MSKLTHLAGLLKHEAELENDLDVNSLYLMPDSDILKTLKVFRTVRQQRVKAERELDVVSEADPTWDVADWERDVLEGREYRTVDLPEFYGTSTVGEQGQ